MKKLNLKSIENWPEEKEKKLFLTAEEVRSFPKYANASNEEVWSAINTLHNLALVSYEAFVKEEKKQMATTKNQAKDQS
jgi:hypothetical protein